MRSKPLLRRIDLLNAMKYSAALGCSILYGYELLFFMGFLMRYNTYYRPAMSVLRVGAATVGLQILILL